MLLLLACATEPDELVSYGGWVYDGPLAEAVVSEGSLTFTFLEGEPVSAKQPYKRYPGYWQAMVAPGLPFELRIEDVPGAYPTVWAGDTPGAKGSWLQGALFAGQAAYFDDLVEGLAPSLDAPVGSLAGGAAHLWGMPTDGSDWDCAALTVGGRTPVCLELLEDGTLSLVESGPFYWFLVFDLEPGVVSLEQHGVPLESWTALAGDLVMAFWLEHG